jgi:hypothetical protein
LSEGKVALEHPLDTEKLLETVRPILVDWRSRRGIEAMLSGQDLASLLTDVGKRWSPDERETFLKRMDQALEPWRKPAKAKGKKAQAEAVEGAS